jgi:peptidoglycan/xylan/chitin deacetylase (PgdA/CDA1 family)
MGDGWLDPLRRELDAAPRQVTFFFRDDDAGWDDAALLALLELFAGHAVPLDLAVIPAALGPELAAELRRRERAAPGLLGLHQHGYAHTNHERTGRPCEFGPSRPAEAQKRDIEDGARRLRRLLGEIVAPIFTPPWNRCARSTPACLRQLGFVALSRDSSAEPLELQGLQEIQVGVDWLAQRTGRRASLPEVGERLAAAARAEGRVGVMLHHALMGPDERAAVEALLGLLASDANASCRSMASLVARRALELPLALETR